MEIKFEQLSHFYQGMKKNDGVAAITDINLTIEDKDEFIALCGQTGSGKSTLAQHLNALLLPTDGSITIFGSKITPKKRKNPPLKPVRRRVGFVFQFPEYQLFEETVLKDIKFAPKIFGEKDQAAEAKAKEVAELLGITDILEKSPFNLSGGQMRKVAIAGILAYDPDILVLDEPTRGLDPKGAKEIMELFSYIHKQMHKTIVLISHDMNIIYQYATRVIVMKDGTKAFDGDKVTLFKDMDYGSFHLEKPEVLKTIDEINKTLNYKISYENYNLDDLLTSIKEASTIE